MKSRQTSLFFIVFVFIHCLYDSYADSSERSGGGAGRIEVVSEADSDGLLRERVSVRFPEGRCFVASVFEGTELINLSGGLVLPSFRAGYLRPEGLCKEMMNPGRYTLLDTLGRGDPSFSVNSGFSQGGYPGVSLQGQGPWGIFCLYPKGGSIYAGSSFSVEPFPWLTLDFFECFRGKNEPEEEEDWIVPVEMYGSSFSSGLRCCIGNERLYFSAAILSAFSTWSEGAYYLRGLLGFEMEDFSLIGSGWAAFGEFLYPDGLRLDDSFGYRAQLSTEQKDGLSFKVDAEGTVGKSSPYPSVYRGSSDSLGLNIVYRSDAFRIDVDLSESRTIEGAGFIVSELCSSCEAEIYLGTVTMHGRGRLSSDTEGTSSWRASVGPEWEWKGGNIDFSFTVLSEGVLKASARFGCEILPKEGVRLYLDVVTDEAKAETKTLDELLSSPFSLMSVTFGFSCSCPTSVL